MPKYESESSRCHVCQFLGKTDNFDFFGQNLPKKGFRVGNSDNYCGNKNQHPGDTMCTNFQAKRTTLTFLTQICTKTNFGVGISKIYVWIRNQHLQIPCVPISSENGTLNFEFFGLNLGKLPNYV